MYGLLFVKGDFLRISLVEAMSDKPENMKHLKFGRVKVNKGKVLPHNAKMSISRLWVKGKDFPGGFHCWVQAALHQLYENRFWIKSLQPEQASFEVSPKCDLSLATDFSAFENHVFMWFLPHFVDLST